MADRSSVIEKVKAMLSKTEERGCTLEEELSALAKARAWIGTNEISDDELFKLLLDCLAPDGTERKEVIRSFVIGCTERINARLIEMCERPKTERTKSSKALAVIQDQAIKDFLKTEGISLRLSRSSRAP